MTQHTEPSTTTCARCGQTATLTRAGYRHGYPPAGHDGHCAGTGLYPIRASRAAGLASDAQACDA